MNLFESISSAFSSIMGNKMRSLLTMFGIIVGISSVMVIVSIGMGYREMITKEFEDLGLDRVSITTDTSGNKKLQSADYLQYDDVEMVRKMPGVVTAGSSVSYGIGDAIEFLDGDMGILFMNGVDNEYLQIESTKLKEGRLIGVADVENRAEVAIVDEDFAKKVFGRTDVLGETLEINLWGESLNPTIIGITESTQMTQLYSLYGQGTVQMPITLIQSVFNMGDEINRIEVKVKDPNEVNKTSLNIIRLLEHKHNNEDKYRSISVSDALDEVGNVINLFTNFIGIVAGISLLVGGIGVMNIMLVSVTERTREIGIRKAIGATNWNIQLQFLIESVIITAMGGVLGIIFGYGGGLLFSFVITAMTQQPITPYISPAIVGFVVLLSALIGIIFGVYPASEAAKLDPIDALSYE